MGGLHLVSWRLNRKRIPSCSPPLSKKEFSTSLPSDFICSFNSLVLQAQSSTLALLGLRPDSPSCRFWTCQAPWSQKLIPYNCILSLSLSTHTHTHTHTHTYTQPIHSVSLKNSNTMRQYYYLDSTAMETEAQRGQTAYGRYRIQAQMCLTSEPGTYPIFCLMGKGTIRDMVAPELHSQWIQVLSSGFQSRLKLHHAASSMSCCCIPFPPSFLFGENRGCQFSKEVPGVGQQRQSSPSLIDKDHVCDWLHHLGPLSPVQTNTVEVPLRHFRAICGLCEVISQAVYLVYKSRHLWNPICKSNKCNSESQSPSRESELWIIFKCFISSPQRKSPFLPLKGKIHIPVIHIHLSRYKVFSQFFPFWKWASFYLRFKQ